MRIRAYKARVGALDILSRAEVRNYRILAAKFASSATARAQLERTWARHLAAKARLKAQLAELTDAIEPDWSPTDEDTPPVEPLDALTPHRPTGPPFDASARRERQAA